MDQHILGESTVGRFVCGAIVSFISVYLLLRLCIIGEDMMHWSVGTGRIPWLLWGL
jgi:multisubunit Na+/H+ antiporter MnhE subunit